MFNLQDRSAFPKAELEWEPFRKIVLRHVGKEEVIGYFLFARDSIRTSKCLVVLGGNCSGAWRVLAKVLESTRAPLVPSGLLLINS